MPIKATRALLSAALDGSLGKATFRKDPNFGFEVPVAVAGVDTALLDPRQTWADPAAYDAQAAKLVQKDVRRREELRCQYVSGQYAIDADVKRRAAAIG
jgi:phosphoenolpyruvate carboxykinase (ATP)